MPWGLLPIIPQSIGWEFLAFGLGIVAYLWVYSIVKLRIFMTVMISTTMVPVALIIIVLHRFIFVEPVLTDAIAFQFCFLGAATGVVVEFMAEILYGLEVMRDEKRKARGRVALGRRS